MTALDPGDRPVDRERAIAALRAGEVVLLPTDTVYGIAVVPTPAGTADLFRLKDRPGGQPLAVLAAHPDQALALVAPLDDGGRRLVHRYWPGPLTLVCPRSPASADFDLGGAPGTIGIRCPAHSLIRAIATEVGPIATTSANRHGQPTPATAAEARAALTGPVAVAVDGGRLANPPSTVVDLTGEAPVVLREGAIPAADLFAAWAG